MYVAKYANFGMNKDFRHGQISDLSFSLNVSSKRQCINSNLQISKYFYLITLVNNVSYVI